MEIVVALGVMGGVVLSMVVAMELLNRYYATRAPRLADALGLEASVMTSSRMSFGNGPSVRLEGEGRTVVVKALANRLPVPWTLAVFAKRRLPLPEGTFLACPASIVERDSRALDAGFVHTGPEPSSAASLVRALHQAFPDAASIEATAETLFVRWSAAGGDSMVIARARAVFDFDGRMPSARSPTAAGRTGPPAPVDG